MVMAHSFRGHGDVSSTPMIPHGGGPSPYRLPKMTQDTPRIAFPDEAAVGHPAQQENYSKDLRTYFRTPTLSTSIKNLIPVESAALDPQYYGARVRTGKCGAVAHASANIPGVTRFRVKKTNAKRTSPIFTSSPQNSIVPGAGTAAPSNAFRRPPSPPPRRRLPGPFDPAPADLVHMHPAAPTDTGADPAPRPPSGAPPTGRRPRGWRPFRRPGKDR